MSAESERDKTIRSFKERFDKRKEEGYNIEITRTTLNDMIEAYYRRCDMAIDQWAMGYFPTYEEQVARVAWALYQSFEEHIRKIFGEEKCADWGLRVFHNTFEDLRELGWGDRDKKTKRSFNFNRWYYGKPGYIMRKENRVTFFDSWAYWFLFDGEPRWKSDFGYLLAMNVELAIGVLLGELEDGTFLDEMIDTGDAIRPSLIYSLCREQMIQIDMRLIGGGDRPFFNIRRQ